LNTNKIIIGVTQFGMTYGIMNKSRFNRKKTFKQILKFSKKNKIQTLYTSRYYGNSNKMLSNENLNFFKIITKLKCEDLLKNNFKFELNSQKKNFKKKELILMLDGFERLNSKEMTKVYNNLLDFKKKNFKKKELILMLDGFERLNSKEMTKVYNNLLDLKEKNYLNKFGYSIYNFKNLKKLCKNFKPDILQCPYNVFDRRIEKNNLLKFLNINKIEIQARSIFLQGLLLTTPQKLPKKFFKWKKNFERFSNAMSNYKVSNLSGCLNFVLNNKYIDKILIGVDNLNQLKEILRVKHNDKIKFINFDIKDEKLIDPSTW